MGKMKSDTPTNLIAEYGLADPGEEDSIILKVRIHDKPVDVEELHAQLGKVIAGWPRDEDSE